MSDFEGHTPGPWSREGEDLLDGNGRVIAEFWVEQEDPATEALILAAPDLLRERDELRAERDRLRILLRTIITHAKYSPMYPSPDSAIREAEAVLDEAARKGGNDGSDLDNGLL